MIDLINFSKFVIVCFVVLALGLVAILFIFEYRLSIAMASMPTNETITANSIGNNSNIKTTTSKNKIKELNYAANIATKTNSK